VSGRFSEAATASASARLLLQATIFMRQVPSEARGWLHAGGFYQPTRRLSTDCGVAVDYPFACQGAVS
jgi:hypothetical protein